MVKNEVLGRIRRSGGYGKFRLGLENRLAGSAEFLPPNFLTSKFHPPPTNETSWTIRKRKVLTLLSPGDKSKLLWILTTRSKVQAQTRGRATLPFQARTARALHTKGWACGKRSTHVLTIPTGNPSVWNLDTNLQTQGTIQDIPCSFTCACKQLHLFAD